MEKKLVVCKSNALIEASYRLTPAEQGIVLCCISQIQKGDIVTDKTMYEVAVTDYAKITGTNLNTAYRDIKEAVIRLWRREVRLSKKPNGEGRHEQVLVTRWIQSVQYSDKGGKVELRFSHDMLPYISSISGCFTKYAIENVAKMSSGFGIRLYEFLCQWKDDGKKTLSVEWLREALLISGKYKTIKDFKRRVIEPAVADINKHSDFWINWSQKKTGRKVTHLKFKFGLKEELKKEKTKPKKQDPRISGVRKSVIEKRARPRESYEEAAERIKREDKQRKQLEPA